MSEQIVIKQKSSTLGFLKRWGAARAKEARERALKEAYMQELTASIQDAYMEWQNALANFEHAVGKDMIDYYAYRIKASQIRYDYLLRKAKEAQNG
jgi:hypothetical protein